jgi:hypothetical protein
MGHSHLFSSRGGGGEGLELFPTKGPCAANTKDFSVIFFYYGASILTTV